MLFCLRAFCVRFGIIMHKNHVSMLSHERSYMGQNDLVNVALRGDSFLRVTVVEVEEHRP